MQTCECPSTPASEATVDLRGRQQQWEFMGQCLCCPDRVVDAYVSRSQGSLLKGGQLVVKSFQSVAW